MLVLTRRPTQSIFMDFSDMTDAELMSLRTSKPIKITLVDVRGDKARLGFDAPGAVRIRRDDLTDPKPPSPSGPSGEPGT